MITASDALMLPTAQSTEAERTAAALLDVEISAYVETHMEFRGCYDIKVEETRPSVIAEVNQRIRRQGWHAEWKPIYRQDDPTNKQKRSHAGYSVDLIPSDEAYHRAAALRARAALGEALLA